MVYIKITFLSTLLLLSPIIASGQTCEEEVRHWAQLHLGLSTDPIIFLKSMAKSNVTTAAVGATVAEAASAKRTSRESRRFQSELNKALKQSRNAYYEVRETIKGVRHDDALHYNRGVFEGLRPKNGKVPKTDITLKDARRVADKIIQSEGIRNMPTPSFRTLISEVFTVYQQLAEIDDLKRKTANEVAKVNRGRFILPRTTAGALGVASATGLYVGQRQHRKRECGAYGLHKAEHYFVASPADILEKNKNHCYLTVQGAADLVNEPYAARNLCAHHPKVLEAMENSFVLYADHIENQANRKIELTRRPEITCLNGYPSVQVVADGIPISIEYTSDNRAQLFFKMTGSAAGPNRAILNFDGAQGPELLNPDGLRLAKDSRDATDYSALVSYYFNMSGAPQDPNLKRRYLVGAGIMSAVMNRPEFEKKCGAPRAEALDYAEAAID